MEISTINTICAPRLRVCFCFTALPAGRNLAPVLYAVFMWRNAAYGLEYTVKIEAVHEAGFFRDYL
jgi:hypothetical protein